MVVHPKLGTMNPALCIICFLRSPCFQASDMLLPYKTITLVVRTVEHTSHGTCGYGPACGLAAQDDGARSSVIFVLMRGINEPLKAQWIVYAYLLPTEAC